jgi:hypothetical protein
MARLKLYRKHGKKYKTELRPSRIDILILPLLVCFLASIVLWCYVTGHNRPETETEPPTAETTAPTEEPTEEEGETEARPAEV